MSGILAILGAPNRQAIQYIGATHGDGLTSGQTQAKAPVAAVAGDMGIFATYNNNNGGVLWPNSANSGSANYRLYWKILTASDLTASSAQTNSWAYHVYRGPINAAFRSRNGFVKSSASVGLFVEGRSAAGATYTDRSFSDNQARPAYAFDNFAPLTPYADNAQVSSDPIALVLEMLSS